MKMALRGNVVGDNVPVVPGGNDRVTALYIARWLSADELMQVFGELVRLASFAHGSVQTVRDLLLSLPREWVLTHIEEAAEPQLHDGTYDEYRRLLELYIQLDHDLTLKLARRALMHSDPGIREAGEDFLDILPSDQAAHD